MDHTVVSFPVSRLCGADQGAMDHTLIHRTGLSNRSWSAEQH